MVLPRDLVEREELIVWDEAGHVATIVEVQAGLESRADRFLGRSDAFTTASTSLSLDAGSSSMLTNTASRREFQLRKTRG
jgi:hypothetical protein